MRSFSSQLRRFRHWRPGPKVAGAIRVGLFVGVVAFFLYQFSEVGWAEVWAALPTEPLFYALLLVSYALYPLSEAYIYGRLWPVGVREGLPVQLRKRVLNQDLVSLSGEAYFFVWAREHVPLPDGRLLRTIKDNLLLASVAFVATTALLLGAFMAAGQVRLLDLVPRPDAFAVGLGAVLVVAVVAVAIRFRRALLSIDRRAALFVLGVHGARFLAVRGLQIAMWWSVVPDAPFEAWATLMSVMMVTNRIPFVPSSDLVFVGLGTRVAGILSVPVATVAGMLLIRSVVEKVLNALVFVATALWDRVQARRAAAAAAEEPADRAEPGALSTNVTAEAAQNG